MTEEEWLTCSDPSSLISSPLIRNSQRKRYLLGVACCRRVWQFCSQPRMCEAVELIERLAETGVTEAEVEKAREWLSWGGPDAVAAAANQTCYALFGAGIHSTDLSLDLSSCLRNACCAVGYDVGYRGGEAAWGEPRQRATQAEREAQAGLVRDVFGNPFRPVALDLNWLCFSHGLVRTMARTIYEERRFQDAPILADALEDAGCDNADILNHLRGPGPHVRGCWALDLLLGKE